MSLSVYLSQVETREVNVFDATITHNFNKMAEAVCLYQVLWKPEELGLTKAFQLVKPLMAGLFLLTSDKDRIEKLNAENGWGTYENFVTFVEKYLLACIKNPNATIRISR